MGGVLATEDIPPLDGNINSKDLEAPRVISNLEKNHILKQTEIIPDLTVEELRDEPNETNRIKEKQLEDKIIEEITRVIEMEKQFMQIEEERINDGKGIGFKMRMGDFYRYPSLEYQCSNMEGFKSNSETGGIFTEYV